MFPYFALAVPQTNCHVCGKQSLTSVLPCPSRTKFCSAIFCMAPKLSFGLDNFRKKIVFFVISGSFITVSSWSWKKIELTRPRVNFGGKQDVDLQNIVIEGHPTRKNLRYYPRVVTVPCSWLNLTSPRIRTDLFFGLQNRNTLKKNGIGIHFMSPCPLQITLKVKPRQTFSKGLPLTVYGVKEMHSFRSP